MKRDFVDCCCYTIKPGIKHFQNALGSHKLTKQIEHSIAGGKKKKSKLNAQILCLFFRLLHSLSKAKVYQEEQEKKVKGKSTFSSFLIVAGILIT